MKQSAALPQALVLAFIANQITSSPVMPRRSPGLLAGAPAHVT
jgi:hypothetical protein